MSNQMTALDHLKEAERLVLAQEPDKKADIQDRVHDAQVAIWKAMELLPDGI